MAKEIIDDPGYLRKRLSEFIRERHPRLFRSRKFIEERSNKAAAAYRKALEEGDDATSAALRAEAVLFQGLIFSRFDTLRCILATEFPMIPLSQQRSLAIELEPLYEDIFSRYTLDDDLVNRSEYNHLLAELIEALKLYFQQNPIFMPRRGRPAKQH